MDTRDSYDEPSNASANTAPRNLCIEVAEPRVPEIRTIQELLHAEVVIDAMESETGPNTSSKILRNRAKAFISKNHDLFDTPWLRKGGAVYDIISQLRANRDDESASVINLVVRF